MTYNDAYRSGIQILKSTGTEAPANDAGVLLCLAAGCDRIFLYTHGDSLLEENIWHRYREMLQKRADGYPLQYITGKQEFMSLTFEVGPGVLIPRQETELLVETVISACRGRHAEILDMCTGSGCIAVSLAWNLPDCSVTAVDILPEAIGYAARNAERNGVSEKICFIRGDHFSEISGQQFDIIVSNPPYIRSGDINGLKPEVKDHEPHAALDGGIDGLYFYRKIIDKSPEYLKKGGMLAFETGYDQACDVSALLISDGRFGDISVYKDLAGLDRVVAAICL